MALMSDDGRMRGDDLRRRAGVHAALGEPLRLAIVDELMVSDRSPTELAQRFDVPSNLLAHHLDVLVDAGVVERIRSSGDARRRYVRLRRRAFDGLVTGRGRPGRMVFVCSQNSARSQLAAAMWSSRTGEAAASAGTHPAAAVHPGAVAAARRMGLDLTDAEPRPFLGVDHDSQLVTVCDQAHEELTPSSAAWHWSIPDPVAVGTDEAFDRAVRELDERIDAITGSRVERTTARANGAAE
jgi:protein-tyrosine-phosphatase/DNA-binding HxlR family transcriptional regulator